MNNNFVSRIKILNFNPLLAKKRKISSLSARKEIELVHSLLEILGLQRNTDLRFEQYYIFIKNKCLVIYKM